jgi:hypothetical protein
LLTLPRKPQVSLALALRRASFSSCPSWGLFAPNPPNHLQDDSLLQKKIIKLFGNKG